jgi:Papain-like cysteine protease AvrRpt2
MGGAEIVVGAEIWFDSAGHILGGAASIGAGVAIEFSEGNMPADTLTKPAIVMPALPNDTRARATRIGGQFSDRIGQALNLGLSETAITPLLDKLDPPTTGVPAVTSQGLNYSQAMSINGDRVVNWIKARVQEGLHAAASHVGSPHVYLLGPLEKAAFEQVWRVVGGVAIFAPDLAHRFGCTISVGPAANTPVGAGGVGVVFGPNGEVGLFAQGQLNDFTALLELVRGLQLDVVAKLGYNTGGIDTFQRISQAASVMGGAEIVVGAEIWFDSAGHILGGAASIGAGVAIEFSEAMNSPQWSINWDGVDLLPQPTPNSCWATTFAMLLGWRDSVCIEPQTIANRCGHDLNYVLPWGDHASTARTLGLHSAQPMCYTETGFKNLIEQHGPIVVTKAVNSSSGAGANTHIVLVVGMYSDGANSFVRIYDSEDRAVGSPGSPGAYAGTQTTGSRYIMRFETFMNEYEMGARGNLGYVQIMYAGVPLGRAINRSSPPHGFAMTTPERTDADAAQTGPGTINLAPPPEPVSRGMEVVGAVATIAGVAIQQITNNAGDVSWTVDQFRGIKHPNDTAPANPGAFQDARPITLNWPVLSDSYIDDISAFFRIDWQHNGKSIGNVRITNVGTNDAIGWSLAVRGTIMDDNRVHQPNGCAGLRITLHYHFTHVIGSDQIALCEIEIFGDGTSTRNCRWIQTSLLGVPENTAHPALALA